MIANLFSRLFDIIGITGVILVLTAYFLLTINKVSALNMSYQLLNFIGSWFVLFSLLHAWNLSSVVIEVSWILISALGIYQSYKASKKKKLLNKNK